MSVELFAAWGGWAGGVGALLAVGLALGLAWQANKRYEAERRESQAAQARTIVAFVRIPDTSSGLLPRVIVENCGVPPVTAVAIESVTVSVSASKPDERYHEWRYKGLPAQCPRPAPPKKAAKVLRPGEPVAIPLIGFDDAPKGFQLPKETDRYEVTCSFYDVQGTNWKRKDTEQPERTSP